MKLRTLEGRVRDLEEAAKKRKKWEYDYFEEDAGGNVKFVGTLHMYGREGWELCSVTHGIKRVAIMKREIIE